MSAIEGFCSPEVQAEINALAPIVSAMEVLRTIYSKKDV